MQKELQKDSYDFDLPKELIAIKPVYPASSAKLLIYLKDKDEIIHETFENIIKYIPNNTKIFLNDTKVIKARVFGKKSSGGKIELLLNKPINNFEYSVFIKGKVKVNTIIEFENNLKAKVTLLNDDGSRVVKFYQNDNKLSFDKLIPILNQIGHIPLPPYINREDNSDDETDYQTLFAKNDGAVAAPTASLHFTPQLLNELKNKFDIYFLTLHVGAGTFKPVEVDNILEHPMHSEYFNIPQKSENILNSNDKILAIGTTVTRTIEFYNKTKQNNGEANIFLHPQSRPKRVDYLLTNFHLPKSTLLMLVASFIGLDKTIKIYKNAVSNNYRFFSYGDAMLIL
jgi:S-adenosylmethionine:tRNA ribosyltransferase-isomerase